MGEASRAAEAEWYNDEDPGRYGTQRYTKPKGA